MKRERNSFLTPLVVEVLPSGKRFRLYNDFTYLWRREYIEIHVQRGFETDFASIPRSLRIIIPKLGRYNKAAVIHDAIYQDHIIKLGDHISFIFNRKWADICFLDAMADLGVAKWKRTLMYWAVRIGGFLVWKGHSPKQPPKQLTELFGV